MSHSTQTVKVTYLFGGRVGEERTAEDAEFSGVPDVPLTDDDLASAQWDALMKARRSIDEKLMRLKGPDAQGPDRR